MDNKNQRFTSTQPGKLTVRGMQHASDLGKALSSLAIDRLVISDLQRVVDTSACAISVSGKYIPITYSVLLREIDFGAWIGKSIGEIRKAASGFDATRYLQMQEYDLRYMIEPMRKELAEHFAFEGLEHIAQRQHCVLELLRQYAEQGCQGIMTISHGCFNAYLVEGALHATCGEHIACRSDGGFFPQGHHEVTVFDVDSKGRITNAQLNLPLERLT